MSLANWADFGKLLQTSPLDARTERVFQQSGRIVAHYIRLMVRHDLKRFKLKRGGACPLRFGEHTAMTSRLDH